MKHYDIIVIGSGGGAKITRPAANLGHKVAVIEKAELGGTCLNHGCIPSKMLIHSADMAEEIRQAHRFELDVDTKYPIRFSDLIHRVQKTIQAESKSIAPVLEAHENIDYYAHTARFVSNKVVQVGTEQLTADRIFIAVGARPYVPPIDGLAGTPYMTYYQALKRTEQPKRLIVLGGGYIATELGYFYHSLGTDVTFVVRSQLLKSEDTDIQAEFTRVFSSHCHTRIGWEVTQVQYENGTFQVTILDSHGHSETLVADALLVATGTQPNTDDLGLENTDIALDKSGYIPVDRHLQTQVPGVYAFGDAIGRYQFRHSANFEGDYLFEALFSAPHQNPISYPPIPHAVFTHPQVASVGKTEQELQKEGVEFVSVKQNYADSGMGMALRSDYGFVKLLADKKTGKLLGAHIIGREAATMIHLLIGYITLGLGVKDLLNVVYIHPALPELIRNAARKLRTLLA